MFGSSPLARGTPRRCSNKRARTRFIPARAGNTQHKVTYRPSASVHPRSRGEHGGLSLVASSETGSSPLARGTRGGSPAHRPRHSVHPRSRGEHSIPRCLAAPANGSSPLARGTLPRGSPFLRLERFIPARAGNTTTVLSAARAPPVHPRSRGEHPVPIQRYDVVGGSSPLARGTLSSRQAGTTCPRFIPARAGNTHPVSGNWGISSVHPRSRGEHTTRVWYAGNWSGSSPLARGTHPHSIFLRDLCRFIPARAGNTPRNSPP